MEETMDKNAYLKTIDEVIWQLEMGLFDNDVHQYHIKYVVPYLKEYKNTCDKTKEKDKKIEELSQQLTEMNRMYIEIADLYTEKKNKEYKDVLPIQWNELARMIGKSIWLESLGDIIAYKGWALIKDINHNKSIDFVILTSLNRHSIVEQMHLSKEDCGKYWFAYRTERP